MPFQSNLNAVLSALRMSKQQALEAIGTTCVADVQLIEPTITGNMKRSTTFSVVSDSEVDVGVTNDAPYAIYVDQGTDKQPAQQFLENGVMQGVGQIKNIVQSSYRSNMVGD